MTAKQDIIDLIKYTFADYKLYPGGIYNRILIMLADLKPKVKSLTWHKRDNGLCAFCSDKGYYSIDIEVDGTYTIYYDREELPGNYKNLDEAKAQCQHYYEQDILSQVEYE